MAWIQLHQELREHPKAKRLARRLGLPLPYVIGHLGCLWLWCLSYAQDGDVSVFDVDDIADAALYPGPAEEFHAALVAEGFIELTDDGAQHVHDWHDYGGKLLNRKKANADRMKAARAANDERTKFNVDDTCKACGEHVEPTEVARVDHVQRTCVARVEPEKRRGDKRRNNPHTPKGVPTGFDEFWTEYPNKVGKAVAQKSWVKINPDEQLRALIMAGLERAKQSPQWLKDDGQFIPHPSTWLNQQRWQDVYSPPIRQPNSNGHSNGHQAPTDREQAKAKAWLDYNRLATPGLPKEEAIAILTALLPYPEYRETAKGTARRLNLTLEGVEVYG